MSPLRQLISCAAASFATLLLAGLATAPAARAGELDDLQALRSKGCGSEATLPALHRDRRLDAAARIWSRGAHIDDALERGGYRTDASATLRVTGPGYALYQTLRDSSCQTLLRAELRDVGIFQGADAFYIILAAPYLAPAESAQAEIAARVLELVNAARERGARCGGREFAPAPPLRGSRQLDIAALRHARDQAAHNYLDHRDRRGRSPAHRARTAGYAAQRVGENIAYGPANAEEVVQGWLASAGHCENLMGEHFAEMGLGYAAGRSAVRHGLYWVQLLAEPSVGR